MYQRLMHQRIGLDWIGIGIGMGWMDLRVGGGIEHLTVLIKDHKFQYEKCRIRTVYSV